MKPVLLRGSRIFRIHILLNFGILLLEEYHFQNSKGLEGLKEYALRFLFDQPISVDLLQVNWSCY